MVLSWVSFWIHREATSDRVGLGITTVLTLSTISLDSRTDLPKVRYATALDWFLLMSFFYCIATLLEFAGVHYFTKVGSGEIPALTDDEWEDVAETVEHAGSVHVSRDLSPSQNQLLGTQSTSARKRNSIICPIYNVSEMTNSVDILDILLLISNNFVLLLSSFFPLSFSSSTHKHSSIGDYN